VNAEIPPPHKLFVVGVGRSGTSLLQAMLASHTEINFLPESSFFRRYVCQREIPFEAAEAKAVLQADARVARLGFNFDSVDFSQLSSNWPEKDLYERFFSQLNHSAYVGDKDPQCIEFAELMLEIWPTCRVIHIFRDPRDVLASKKKADWSKHRSTFFHLVAGAAQFGLGQLATRQFGTERVFTLRYEGVLSEPRQSMTQVCEWLGLEFEEGMLEFNAAAAKLTATDEHEWKKETMGPLMRTNKDKWRSELSDFESYAVEVACKDTMSLGGYVPVSQQKTISVLNRIGAAALGNFARLAAMVYRWRKVAKNREFVRRFVR